MTHGAPPDLLDSLRRALAAQYDVDRLLGQGGMGSVFLGRDRVLDRPVAIKVVSSELAGSTQIRDRFLQEARVVARLRHPGIVAVYAAGDAEGLLYFVMEYVEGESLADRIAREGRIAAPETAVIVRDLARALAYAHGQGVVHRDVKPENVLLDRATGRALLVDFGVARAFSGGDARATATGFVLGSPKYMSPEQASGERDIDGRSDVYSLGLVAYEMLCGEAAVSASTPGSALVAQITQRPVPLGERAPGTPAALVQVIEHAIEKSPDERWASASAFAEALDAVVAGRPAAFADVPARTTAPGLSGLAAPGPAAVPTAPAAAPARRRWPLVAAAGGVVAALAGAWVAFGGGGVPRGVDPRKSFLVAPFEVTGSQAADLAWLREGSVSMLALNLAQWKDLSVVDYERSLDLLHDAKLDDEPRIGFEQASTMARRAGVWTVVMGRITGTPDSVLVEARLYDVASGRKLDEAQHAIARAADPRPVFDALARDLLDLVGAPRGLALQSLTQSTTGNLEAYRAYLDGQRALNGWQLGRADSLFARATRLDSTFALAYYRRALTTGWRNAQSPEQQVYIEQAIAHGGRLPQAQREIFDAYRDLTQALRSSAVSSDSARTNALYASAQRKYAALVQRDSANVEAWYGLGDAYFHHQPDGYGNKVTVGLWSKALRAFDRVLVLDSTFHLAYSHRLDIYRRAASRNVPFALLGDTLAWFGDSAAYLALGGRRAVDSLSRLAAARAKQDAAAWARTDPVPQAYMALVGLYAETSQYDSALAVLDNARRSGVRSPKLAYLAAALQAWKGGPQGVAAVRQALAEHPVEALKAEGSTGDVVEVLVQAGHAAAFGGGVREIDGLAATLATLFPDIPGANVPGALVSRWWVLGTRAAMGVPWATLRPAFDSTQAALERLTTGDRVRVRGQFASPLYVAYLASGNLRYAEAYLQWAPWMKDATELQALMALSRGDSATARALAAKFPDADSVRREGVPLTPVRWIARAQVLEELGDPRRAVTYYEALDPGRFTQQGRVDATFALYAPSFLARGRLYEQVGDRAKAAASYRRLLELWRDGDAALEPQRREARAGLARLGDAAGQGVPVTR